MHEREYRLAMIRAEARAKVLVAALLATWTGVAEAAERGPVGNEDAQDFEAFVLDELMLTLPWLALLMARQGWREGTARCRMCGREWHAVYTAAAPVHELECPACGQQVSELVPERATEG